MRNPGYFSDVIALRLWGKTLPFFLFVLKSLILLISCFQLQAFGPAAVPFDGLHHLG